MTKKEREELESVYMSVAGLYFAMDGESSEACALEKAVRKLEKLLGIEKDTYDKWVAK